MSEPHVRTMGELEAVDGRLAVVHGRYRALPMPVKGAAPRPRPADRAVIVLADDAELWLEPYDSPAAERQAAERERFDGRPVRVSGTVYSVMPARGQSLIAPCISDVRDIEEES